jgi:hypothetical protein
MNRRPIIKKEGDSNLVSNWEFWIRGRWHNFLPDLLNKDFPRLSTSSGGNSLRRSLLLGGQLCSTRLDLHYALRRRRCVLPKRTTGAIGKKQKGDPSSFVGSGPSSYCKNEE